MKIIIKISAHSLARPLQLCSTFAALLHMQGLREKQVRNKIRLFRKNRLNVANRKIFYKSHYGFFLCKRLLFKTK